MNEQKQPLHANVNDIARKLREMEKYTLDVNEFQTFLKLGNLHLYILKLELQARNWYLKLEDNKYKYNRGSEAYIYNLDNAENKISINIEFSPDELKFNIEDEHNKKFDYYVFITLKYIFFVDPEDVKQKKTLSIDELFKVSRHTIQFADLILL